MIKLPEIKFDCRYFKGHIPCKPNKLYGAVCNKCEYYDKTEEKVLIIKLGAAGDVIRTTPILYPLKRDYPNAKIYWLTYSPSLVPSNVSQGLIADEILDYNLQNVSFLKEVQFDLLINLDKDKEAISLADTITAKKKLGFTLKNGYCYPINENAEHKFITGLFDNVSQGNNRSYLDEMFEICGYKYEGEKYILNVDESYNREWSIDKNKRVVGLNTGCGSRWISRLWENDKWLKLIELLNENGFEVVLLGGPDEHERNTYLSENSAAKYFGTFNLKTFINLVNQCDLVVTQVTMGMHIALGLGKKLVLMNNIFNPNEFELYGNGAIVSPRKECKCYFAPQCTNDEYRCMDYMMPEDVFKSCNELLSTDQISSPAR